jgi:hypothetical protein
MSSKTVTISLDDKRKKVGVWWQKLQHVIGGVPFGLSRKRRFIRVDDAGLHVYLTRFTKFDVGWTDVIDIRLGERNAIVVTKGGSHTIPLNRYLNARDITNALADWRDRQALARAE